MAQLSLSFHRRSWKDWGYDSQDDCAFYLNGKIKSIGIYMYVCNDADPCHVSVYYDWDKSKNIERNHEFSSCEGIYTKESLLIVELAKKIDKIANQGYMPLYKFAKILKRLGFKEEDF